MKKFQIILLCGLMFVATSVNAQTYGPWNCGTQGNNVTASIIDGTLTISGTGAMADYNSVNTPWYNYRDNILAVNITDNVTSIGSSAFQYCNNLVFVTVPKNLTAIGDYAFMGCWMLTSVSIPSGVTSIGISAFAGCLSCNSI